MTDRSSPILVLNRGSTSLKASIRRVHDGAPAAIVLIDRLDTSESRIRVDDGDSVQFQGDLAAAVERIAQVLADLPLAPVAVAHRVVHGGPKHDQTTLIDQTVIADLNEAVPLAPLHLPGAITLIERAFHEWPDARHIACFDTAFHRELPEASRRLPVPRELDRFGVRRYGFHGLSLESILLTRPNLGDAVIAHLGGGCSVTAVDRTGRARHTTMSMTPTAGMMSATRSGDLDPLIPLRLIEHGHYTVDECRAIFEAGSGLAGIANGRHDMRELMVATDDDARLAVEMFVASAAMSIAACATTLDSWASLVFTGGVGEHQPALRDRICSKLRLQGVNVLVVPADEELAMDRDARTLLGRS